ENAKRKHAVCAGTVGGLMAVTKNPFSSSNSAALSTTSFSLSKIGTIALCATSMPSCAVKLRSRASGRDPKYGSSAIILTDATAEATTDGGKAVEKIRLRALVFK